MGGVLEVGVPEVEPVEGYGGTAACVDDLVAARLRIQREFESLHPEVSGVMPSCMGTVSYRWIEEMLRQRTKVILRGAKLAGHLAGGITSIPQSLGRRSQDGRYPS